VKSGRRLGLESLEDRIALSSVADLDPTFGGAGRIPGSYTFGTDTIQVARSAPLADGSLILAGTPSRANFIGVLHAQANGTLDPAFGNGGLAQVSFGVTGARDTVLGVSSFAGKTLVGVEVYLDTLHVFLGAARLDADGTLDPTFGSGGISIVAVDPDSSTFSGLAMGVTPAGGVVLLAGLQSVRPSNVLVQLTPTGTPDPSFGTNGTLPFAFVNRTRDTSGLLSADYLRDLAVQPDGKIVLAGQAALETSTTDVQQLAVARLGPDGTLDPTFGSNGKVTLPTVYDAYQVALQPDGSILVGSYQRTAPAATFGSQTVAGVLRLTASGQLDSNYGVQGIAQLASVPTNGYSGFSLAGLAVQGDGKLVVLSVSSLSAHGFSKSTATIYRLTTTGAFDRTAGGSTGFTVGQGGNGFSPPSLAIQPDGKYVVVASVAFDPSQPSTTTLVVSRYLGASVQVTLPKSTPATFDPSTATWYVTTTSPTAGSSVVSFSYGAPGWIPVVGDWSGTGKDGIGVVDPSTMTWYLRNSDSAGAPDYVFSYGAAGWTPVVGDWNGTGKDGIGVVDPSTMTWYLRSSPSAGAPSATFQYGAVGWTVIAGDWLGTGRTGIGVVDPTTSTWYLRSSSSAGAADAGVFSYGAPGWKPVVGDWTGSGQTSIGIIDPTTVVWYLRKTPNSGYYDAGSFPYGLPGWIPLAGSF
jgi:uncharacterized delta-60 repeat protein